MISKLTFLAAAIAVAQASTPQGFNYGADVDFASAFKQAQALNAGFSSARLYSMLAPNTQNPTSALQAALDTKTSLLLGMWVSDSNNPGDDSAFNNEFQNGLVKAYNQYKDSGLKDLIVGISVGSEDMYRDSPTGKANPNAGPGKTANDIENYMNKVRDWLNTNATEWKGIPVGHVDTWTAWTDPAYSSAAQAADFVGTDAYPYWQTTDDNGIENALSLFNQAYQKVQAATGGKPVWITETGWASAGPSENKATSGADNAKTYYDAVGCGNFGKIPTWWYTLTETPTGSNPDFSVTKNGKALFDLSCANVANTTSAGSTSSGVTSGSASTATGSSTGSGSGSSNGTYSASGSPSKPTATGSSTGSGSGSGSGSSGSSSSGSGSSGSGSGSSSSSGAAASSTIKASGANTVGALSFGSLLAIAGAFAALL